jgi:glycosyltransferase involved in cell wall biosynthesis
MVLKGYPRISETFIANEILLLESLGFAIHILSMRHPRESFSHECVERIKARVDYLPETIQGNLGRLFSANLAWLAKHPWRYLKGLGHAIVRLAKTRRSATLKHLLQAGYLAAKVLPGSGVTHLHAHFAHSPASVAEYAAILTGLPFSFTAHAKDIYTQDKARLAEKLAKAAFAVTCTGYNLEYLSGLNAGHTPLYRVYHGIDLGLFNPGAPRAKAEPPYRILTVARLTAKKGLMTVLKALAILQEQGLEFRYQIIGDGEQRLGLESLAQDLGLAGRLDWLGTKPHDAVIECFKRADVFLLGCEVSQNGDRDGIPNVLAESMAMGVPVAATAVSAIPELIENGRHGLLVPPGDPSALAGAASRLLTDHGLRQEVIRQARQRVEAMFDNRRLVKDLAAIMRAHLP